MPAQWLLYVRVADVAHSATLCTERGQILLETLRDHDAPDEVVEAWVSHQDSLRALITNDPDSDCQG